MTGPTVTAVVDDETWLVELTVHGSWDRTLWQSAFGLVNKCLAQHPAGILLDLRDLHDPDAISAPLWFTAATYGAQMDPPVRVAVCLPSPSALAGRLDRLVSRQLVHAFPSVTLARSFLTSSRTLLHPVRLHLPPDPAVAARARHVVTLACEEWGMEPLVSRARLVVSELVLNAAEHAGTAIDVLISRRMRGTALHLCVMDGDRALPRMRPEGTSVFGERGYGLRIVDAAVHTWGALPTRTGKMVWTLIR